jgi:inner membrane protein
MRSRFSSTQRSVSFKVLFIGLLVLLLLIPVGMIRAVIHDRDATSASAAQDIKRSWGGEQQIAAPVLVLPFERSEAGQYGLQVQRHRRLYVLPDSLRIDVDLRPEMRYRGIHKVPIYSSTLRFSGTFAAPADAIRKVDGAKVDWEKLYIAVGVSDPRAISKSPQIDIGGRTSGFVAGGQHIGGLPLQITAPTPNLFDDGATEALSFEFELNLNGTNSLQFVPLGDTTEVIATPFFGNDGLVNSACRKITVPAALGGAHESLVVTQVEVGLGAVMRHENLTVLEGAHRPRVHVDVWIQLDHADGQSACFEKRAQASGGNALAQ